MTKKSGDKTGSTENKPQPEPPRNVRRNAKGQLLPGSNLNPSGPPRGYKQFKTLLKEGLEAESERIGVPYPKHIAQMALRDPTGRALDMLLRAIEGHRGAETMVNVAVSQTQVSADHRASLEGLPAAGRVHLRALLQIGAAAVAPGGASTPPPTQIDAQAKPVRKKTRRRPSGARSAGNGRKNGNGRKKKPKRP